MGTFQQVLCPFHSRQVNQQVVGSSPRRRTMERQWRAPFLQNAVILLVILLVRSTAASGWGRLSSVKSWQRVQDKRVPELLEGSVRYDQKEGTFSFVRGVGASHQEDSPAFGSFSDPVRHKSNFGQLRITTNPAYSDLVQMQAAGFLEGYLTAERIFDYAYNMKAWLASQTNDTFKLGDWLFEQDRWTREQVKLHEVDMMTASAAASSASSSSSTADQAPASASSSAAGLKFGSTVSAASARRTVKSTFSTSSSSTSTTTATPDAPTPPSPSYWATVGLLLAQSDSLLAGYSARLAELGPTPPIERLTKWDFLVLNALGDMDDLLGIVFPSDDDGSDTSDYDDLVDDKQQGQGQGQGQGERQQEASGATGEEAAAEKRRAQRRAGRRRQPNPERDSSFFFREEEPSVAAQGEKEEDSEDVPPPVRRRGSWDDLTPGQVRSRIAQSGRCSALVKVTPGLDDLLLGHVTWWSYSSMLRIYKHYDIKLAGTQGSAAAEGSAAAPGGSRPPLRNLAGGPVNGRVSFSSYPGQISSSDDWYLLGSGLVVTETSLDTYDHNRYNASYGCTTASLLSWQRVLAANMLAVDGPSWAEVMAAYNGGTYNNQYMIVNLNLFVPGSELQPGLLTISEIIPGLVVTADATADLERGHWPSYNVPYFPEVYDAAGYRRHAEAMAARGPEFAAAAEGISYQLAPRAKIFRRDAADATDLDSFRRLLRSNGFRPRNADPLSAASPWDALCSRGDIDPESPAVYGCYDGKVTNYKRALELSSDAINGPTTEGGQPPFRWDAHARFRRVPHRGMPDVFDTEWEEQRP